MQNHRLNDGELEALIKLIERSDTFAGFELDLTRADRQMLEGAAAKLGLQRALLNPKPKAVKGESKASAALRAIRLMP